MNDEDFIRSLDHGVEQIRARWANQNWPNIGYFVHGQAREDIAALLSEIDRLRENQNCD